MEILLAILILAGGTGLGYIIGWKRGVKLATALEHAFYEPIIQDLKVELVKAKRANQNDQSN